MRRSGPAALGAAIVVAGVAWFMNYSTEADSPAETGTKPPADVGAARQAVGRLPVRDESAVTGYDRDEFHVWSTRRGECDTRAVLLMRTSTAPTETNEHCTVTAGSWRGAYTGRTLTAPSDVDVDHFVPLAEAWRSGAARWSEQRREQFGNDLESGQLVPAESSANSTKSDSDPAAWWPNTDRCGYAARWISIKADYGLSVDPDERSALDRQLTRCGK